MPAIFDFLYQEYCRARLAEMRKQLLLRTPQTVEIPGVESTDRNSFTDDMTAGHSSAKHLRLITARQPNATN
jgi:hypothetical protein